jgi:hypothetical protein
MDWKLIFKLSLFGLGMAVATLSWIPGNIEPYLWLVIFITCAYIIAKNVPGKYFLHGFLVSLVNSAWITGIHVVFIRAFFANHPEAVEMNAHMPIPAHPRASMIIVGPFLGAGFGLILGLFAFVASKIVKRNNQ